MKRWRPHTYQRAALAHLHRQSGRGAALFLDPGAGKTATVLQYIVDTKQKAVIVAPVRVIHSVWRQEAEKWEQFKHLKFSLVHGTPVQRDAALRADADIYLINPEYVSKILTDKKISVAFWSIKKSLLVIDESSKFKSHRSARTKAMIRIAVKFKDRILLTGTPTPQGMMDLWSQFRIADYGHALGTGITEFKQKYFYQGGYKGYEWLLRAGAQEEIEERIKDVAFRIDMEKYIDLPPVVFNDILVDMPARAMKTYREVEQDLFCGLDSGGVLTADSAGARYNKCRQIANGCVYGDDGMVEFVHDQKIQAVESLVEELNGKPLLLAYQFRHDLSALRKKWPKIPYIAGGVSGKAADDLCRQWNAGKLPLLAVHPLSLSHGVNMQAGGNDLAWFGLTDNLESYLQLNKRLHRQGVAGQVRIHRIIARRTIELAMRRNLNQKEGGQASLLKAISEYRRSHG